MRTVLSRATSDTAYALTAADLAQTYNAIGEVDSVLRYTAMGIRTLGSEGSTDDTRGHLLIRLHKLRGIAHHTASVYDSALMDFQRMYRYAEHLGRKADMGAALTYQGYQFREMGDVRHAIHATEQAILVLASDPTGQDMANAYTGLGSAYADIPDTDSSLMWLKKAAELYKKSGNAHHLLNTYGNMGETYIAAGMFAQADSIWEAAADLVKEEEDPVAYVHYAGGHARVLMRKGRPGEALHVLDSAIVLAQDMEYLNAVHQLAYMRSLAKAGTADWEGAFADMKRSMDAYTEDMDDDKIRSTEAARQEFEREKERALAELELHELRQQRWGAIVIGTLAVLLALVSYRSYRAKSLANEEIRRAQTQLIESEKQREAEQVRTRIARDIHDDIGATLTKIALLSGVATQKSQDPAELGKTFARISEHTRNVSRALSDVVWAVDPQRDTHQGMLDHVRDLSQRLLGDNGIRFDLDLHATQPTAQIAPALKRDLHLVLNECFNNILKYAHAKLVKVKLDLRANAFELQVDDDGVGFDAAAVPERGNGLKNMPMRIAQHGGKLTISGVPGKGTSLHAHGPLS